jgi:hypothetical protein
LIEGRFPEQTGSFSRSWILLRNVELIIYPILDGGKAVSPYGIARQWGLCKVPLFFPVALRLLILSAILTVVVFLLARRDVYEMFKVIFEELLIRFNSLQDAQHGG